MLKFWRAGPLLVRVQVAAVLSVTTVIRDSVKGLCSFLHIQHIFSRVCQGMESRYEFCTSRPWPKLSSGAIFCHWIEMILYLHDFD